MSSSSGCAVFCYKAPASPQIYTLSLHDALPISLAVGLREFGLVADRNDLRDRVGRRVDDGRVLARTVEHERSEEHTSELQSRPHLVCRLLLEKKKHTTIKSLNTT